MTCTHVPCVPLWKSVFAGILDRFGLTCRTVSACIVVWCVVGCYNGGRFDPARESIRVALLVCTWHNGLKKGRTNKAGFVDSRLRIVLTWDRAKFCFVARRKFFVCSVGLDQCTPVHVSPQLVLDVTLQKRDRKTCCEAIEALPTSGTVGASWWILRVLPNTLTPPRRRGIAHEGADGYGRRAVLKLQACWIRKCSWLGTNSVNLTVVQDPRLS